MSIKCPLTGSSNVKTLHKQTAIPIIQNKVYSTVEAAKAAKCNDVILTQCLDNGFVFNANFDKKIIEYDPSYQNEQSNSFIFQRHLEDVIGIMNEHKLLDGKVIEVGCGKAYFLQLLYSMNVDIIGFDPTYEGNSPRVIKDFFSNKYKSIEGDFVILRHTLEHIPSPLQFLKEIAIANNNKGKVYIEVPTFEWILKHNSIEDIFYEHCNYFTLETLQMLFKKSIGGYLFNDQYIYVVADFADLKQDIEICSTEPIKVNFDEKISQYKQMVKELDNLAIWGAGAKGSTFLNLVDKECKDVNFVIDINPKKQNQYIGGTGHYILPPSELEKTLVNNIIIMNNNYLKEITSLLPNNNINLITI